jgi:hypothetical protein
VAGRLGLPYRLVPHAEIISSLGDALASVREEVERAWSDAAAAEALAREAEEAAIRAGAKPESVEVVLERNEERGTLRAVATGHVTLAAPVPQAQMSEAEARLLAAQATHVKPEALSLLADTGGFWVYQSGARLFRPGQTLVVDRRGAVRLTVSGGKVFAGTVEMALAVLNQELAAPSNLWGLPPNVRLLIGPRLLDLTAVAGRDGVLPTAKSALARAENGATIALIIEK